MLGQMLHKARHASPAGRVPLLELLDPACRMGTGWRSPLQLAVMQSLQCQASSAAASRKLQLKTAVAMRGVMSTQISLLWVVFTTCAGVPAWTSSPATTSIATLSSQPDNCLWQAPSRISLNVYAALTAPI